jgi:hypothetical protein
MTAPPQTLERKLIDDLRALGDRLGDERLIQELYRALASRALSKRGVEGHIVPSYKRAEEILNLAREAQGAPAVEGLAGSGGEGEVSDWARETLEEIGWESRPADTGHHDDAHVWSSEDPPPASRGETEPPEWERRAHEEAERNRLRRVDRPARRYPSP